MSRRDTKPLIAGNWKLHKTIPEALELAGALKRDLAACTGADLLVCPPFVDLKPVADLLQGSSIALGGQDLFWEDAGAFTGAISGPMLRSAGCSHVIIGHSERREHFGDTDQIVNKKIRAAITSALTPILCVGESLEKREQKVTKEFLRKQLGLDIRGIGPEWIARIIVAYEPIWAIGTGMTATPRQAGETHRFIRELFAEHYNDSIANNIRILYGGSVKPDNARVLIAEADVDGFLVGGASLDAAAFVAIARCSTM
ncbi:MAG: triose-phosphate isomerase [PVC group bacterium]